MTTPSSLLIRPDDEAALFDTAWLDDLSPIDALTRREFVVGGAALAALVAGCRGDDDDAGDRTANDVPTTREIEDYFGTVEIPTDPERVVAGDSVTLGNMVALGVMPVGAKFNVNSLPRHLADQVEDVESILEGREIDWEKVLSLQPDLFVTFAGSEDDPWNKETYDKAAEAVPTFGYVYNYVYLEQLQRNFTELARALNREDVAADRMADLDDRIAALAARVQAAGLGHRPVTTLRLPEGDGYSVRIGTSESIAFRALGIAQPDGQTNPEDFSIELSEENIRLLDSADTLFVYEDDTAEGKQERIESSPLWQALPAVQNDRVHFVNSGIWNTADIDGFELILDDIETYFIEPAE